MLLLALVAAAIVGWLAYTGKLGPRARRKLALVMMGIGGLWLAGRGQWVAGLAVGAGALFLALRQRVAALKVTAAMPADEARRILGLGPDASVEEIRRAHRRIIAQVHPDKGGSAELAHRVNMARDRLIRE